MSDKPLDLTSQAKAKTSPSPTPGNSGSTNTDNVAAPPVRHSKIGDLHVINEQRDTVIYHGDDVTVRSPETTGDDEDDSFYEYLSGGLRESQVTLDDVKSMYRDLQRRREDLEGAPFKGQKLRALEKETSILKRLHDHPNTAVRIRFPDRYVLQGMFRTSDTIGSVKSWLREHFADSSLDFYLFTAPPKKVLQDDTKLVDEGLVAMVVIYFGSQNMPENNRVLKSDLYSKLSDPEKAFELAKTKLKVRNSEGEDDNDEIKPSTETQVKDHSNAQASSGSQSQPPRRPVDKGKVPKWFKMK